MVLATRRRYSLNHFALPAFAGPDGVMIGCTSLAPNMTTIASGLGDRFVI
jgi:hypothetical protein